MNTPMKTSALEKQISQLEKPTNECFRPDISNLVENISFRINGNIIHLREIFVNLKSEKFDPSMLNANGEAVLVRLLDAVELSADATRKKFEEFEEDYQKMLADGYYVSDFAKTCLKNAHDASADFIRNFELEREKIMETFYDALPSDVRLGDAPIFGGDNSPDIGDYLSKLS